MFVLSDHTSEPQLTVPGVNTYPHRTNWDHWILCRKIWNYNAQNLVKWWWTLTLKGHIESFIHPFIHSISRCSLPDRSQTLGWVKDRVSEPEYVIRKVKVMYNIKLCGARIKRLQRSKFAEMKGELAWRRKTVCDHREGLSDDFTSLEPYLPRLLLTSVLFSDILF